ncbi:HlyD family type I secretion periplasmic adaptor subunit [Ferrimonas aestuarii]|uniref:Membrane fusion protein (MFP) family protein n=1 Tax=Ferrimonas aestuarii TaxID=2569539 RepID=A0A4U1BRM6_9GAMM|nr:HlyD family type I secretion periplasmic adaptor subunit [Ferrimonas aestuarii]TKB57430.1 HlyD family type I secretion periplasmic adaptor subunit [Ferrimonas aestuarii]
MPNKTSLRQEDADYLGTPQVAILMNSPSTSRWLLWAIASFIPIALLWANFSHLDTVTTGDGKVIPSSQRQVVQNLEGGLIKSILVKEGQSVNAGQLLMEIDDTRFQADYREREQQQRELEARAIRLKAEIDAVTPIVDKLKQNQPLPTLFEQAQLTYPDEFAQQQPLLLQRQRAQFHSQLNSLANQIRQLNQQVSQKQQELLEANARVGNLRQSYRLAKSEYDLTKPLADEGVVSQVEILKLERQTNDNLRELKSAELQQPGIEAAIQESIYKRSEAAIRFVSDRRSELNEAEGELAAMRERRVDLQDKVSRTQVRSPVAGIIQKLHINTLGGVVQPGADLIDIVPNDDNLLIETKIAPQDIAFLRPGLKSIVKFSAYDFTRYGGLSGELEHISADTTVDEEGNSFYLVRIRTERNYLGDAQSQPIIPGMTASVDIISGQRSILDYLTKPMRVASQTALRER